MAKLTFKTKLEDLKIPETITRMFPKSGAADWDVRLLDLPHPVIYLSSVLGAKGWTEKDFWDAVHHPYRCFSYSYAGYSSPFLHRRHMEAVDFSFKSGVRMFLDSGAHSFHNLERFGKTLVKKMGISKDKKVDYARSILTKFTDQYVQYVKWSYSKNRKFDFYVTMDAQKNCQWIYQMTKTLNAQGIWPIPVYHGDDSLDWVKRYIDDGHTFLGVGLDRKGKPTRSSIYKYYDKVHSLCQKHKIGTHGFAATGDIMFRFPWTTVDSTTYLKAAGFGKMLVIIPEKQRVAEIHVSDKHSRTTPYKVADNLTKIAYADLRHRTESLGFDFERVRREFPYRCLYNVRALQEAVVIHNHKPLAWRGWESLV